jgi:hypothetical protein
MVKGIGPGVAARALVFMLFVLAPALASAQATIAGVVRDSTGAVLPGVTVEAASPALIEKVRVVYTDADGLFRIVDLRPGGYTVTFTLPGFRTFRRDGVTLEGVQTATVNGDLSLGALEEAITVTGEAPMVDAASTAKEQVVTRELLNALPTGRQMWTVAVTVPGIQLNGQDVGGAGGLQQTRMRAFGTVEQEVTIEVDGILMNSVHGGGSTQQYFNDGMVQEMSISTGALGAETQTGGVRLNMIPQTGGNEFHGSLVGLSVPNKSFQSSNLTQELRNRGLTSVNSVLRIHDYNASAGGPIKRDSLWFFASNRTLIGDTGIPNVDYPEGNRIYQGSGRLTWQGTAKHRVTGFYEWTKKTKSAQSPAPGTEFIATNRRPGTDPYEVAQLKWTATLSPRLLLESGWGFSAIRFITAYHDGVRQDRFSPEWYRRVARQDLVLNTLRVAGTPESNNINHRNTYYSSGTYVTGSHSVKAGGQWSMGPLRTITDMNGDLIQRYRSGVPDSVTVYNTPFDTVANTDADAGLFAQDAWRVGNLTLNMGLRYDYFASSVPEQSAPAGRFVPARKFERIESPTFNDISPRLNAAYDPFGDGKTAFKVGYSKFVNRMTGGTLVNPYNPLFQTTDTRTWNDLNRDDIAQDNEIGPSTSSAFGARRARNADPDLERPYNNFYNVSVDRQLTRGLSAGVGYYRRTFHRLFTQDNVLVTPADFTPRQVANPLGGTLTVYNLAPAKLGAVNILDTNDPNQRQTYNGFDVNFQYRFAGQGRLIGGFTTERWVIDNCSIDDPNSPIPAGATPGTTGGASCRQSDLDIPFKTQVKLTGFYPLPWYGVEFSGVFMSFPGAIANTDYLVNRTISPGLTQTSITVPLAPAGTKYLSQRNQADFSLAKALRFGDRRLRLQFDLFNALNASTVMATFQTFGPRLDSPTEILQGRLFRIGAQFHF